MDAFGSTKVVSESVEKEVARGGLSGSGWLFLPSLIQTYCSLPKVDRVTGPEKPTCRLWAESSNETFTPWALFSSRLTNINDQFPSGRCTAYDVTSRFPSLSLTLLEDGNIECVPARC